MTRRCGGRFASKRIYTHVNNLLVAVNPYEELPLYGIDVLHSYTQYGEKSPAPHVFGVGAATYRGLLDARSQSVIISGESGAGKTESAKKFLQYLAYAATLGGGVTTAEAKLEQRVIATSPLMEAFGNAQTVMNNNSSRYGKFLMLQFDLSGKIMGASIKTYLLEKVRIVARGPGERNYHMFYYLAAGAPRARRAAPRRAAPPAATPAPRRPSSRSPPAPLPRRSCAHAPRPHRPRRRLAGGPRQAQTGVVARLSIPLRRAGRAELAVRRQRRDYVRRRRRGHGVDRLRREGDVLDVGRS